MFDLVRRAANLGSAAVRSVAQAVAKPLAKAARAIAPKPPQAPPPVRDTRVGNPGTLALAATAGVVPIGVERRVDPPGGAALPFGIGLLVSIGMALTTPQGREALGKSLANIGNAIANAAREVATGLKHAFNAVKDFFSGKKPPAPRKPAPKPAPNPAPRPAIPPPARPPANGPANPPAQSTTTAPKTPAAERGKTPLQTHQIERNGASSQATSQFTRTRALTYLGQTRAQETAALNGLQPDHKAAYQRTFAAIAASPEAQASLRQMLLGGKLTRTARGGDQASLMTQLDRIATQDLAPGLDRGAMLDQTIREILDPSGIDQRAKNTCAATTAQILLARTDPAEYARLVAGLASASGKVTTISGETLTRKADWNADDGGRSVPSKLLQPTFMELGNRMFKTYDNTGDRNSDGSLGLDVDESNHLFHSITGKDYEAIGLDKEPAGSPRIEEAYGKLKTAVAAGKPVPAAVFWGQTGHKILVTRVEGGRVHFVNPEGTEDSLTESEFKLQLKNLNLPK